MATTEEPIVSLTPAVAEPPVVEEAVNEENPPKPVSQKEPKVKKVPAPRKRGPATHPPYFDMIKDAIVTLKERAGSSLYAVQKFIEEKQKNLPPNFRKLLFVQLKKLVENAKLVKVKSSYKLPPTRPSRSAAAAKKPASKTKPKPKAVATKENKVTVSKPKPKPKPKAAKPEATAVVKPKSVAKAKPATKPKAATPTKAKPKVAPKRKAPEKSKVEKKPPAKAAKTSTRSTPRKASATLKKAPTAKKAASVKKSPVRKAATKKGRK